MIFIFVWIQATLTEALNIYLRTNIIIFFNLMLFYHSKGLDIVRAFFMLKFPKRFIATFYFTWKMIIELQNEFKKIKTTLVTRNFHSKTNLFSYQTYGNILGLLFIKSIQKSQQQKEIFLLRGFDGEIYLQTQFKVCSFDWYLMAMILATLLLRIFL